MSLRKLKSADRKQNCGCKHYLNITRLYYVKDAQIKILLRLSKQFINHWFPRNAHVKFFYDKRACYKNIHKN